MNKVYIITYTFDNKKINVKAYQSESIAKYNFEMIKQLASKYLKLFPDSEYYDNVSEEEVKATEFAINNFENTLSKEELDFFIYVHSMKDPDIQYLDGEFNLESMEMEYVN